LQDNLSSGVHILLRTKDATYLQGKTLNLFNNGDDSVYLKNIHWGVYDIGIAEAFKQKDTLVNVFSTAFGIDSSKWAAIYLIDEDRPISLSGKTAITGNVYLPKAGAKAAYVDNKAYEGDKRLVVGKIHDSERNLPPLNESRLNLLAELFNMQRGPVNKNQAMDPMIRSFRSPTQVVNLGNNPYILKNTRLSGNVILYADTLLTIDSTAILNDVLVFAKAIVVKSGFHGNCQLFRF
jgi:hypothetical protein